MDTDITNRVITEISSRLGVGYSVFSDAVSQYAQTKATESLIYSVVLFCAALLTVIIYYFVMWRNSSIEPETKAFIGFLFAVIFAGVVIPGTLTLVSYFNWSSAPQGMFLREIVESIK